MSLLDSLVAYWKLDEDTGNRADEFGSNTLADSGTVGSRGGQRGMAASFWDTISDYLHIADNTDLSMGDIDFTIAGWVVLDDISANRGLFGKWAATGNNREYLVFYNSSAARFQFIVSPNGQTPTTAVSANNLGAPSTGTRYFIVAWHDATANTINIQVNNGTADSAAFSGGVFDGTTSFMVGAWEIGSPAGGHNGAVDELGVWKKVLSTAEKTALYNNVSGAYAHGLTYPFNYEFDGNSSNPILVHNTYAWDTTRLAAPSIAEHSTGTDWVMFMAGRDGTSFQGIGYATAPKNDPHNWTRNADLIISNGAGGSWDEEIASASGFWNGTGWEIWYDSRDGGIGLATGAALDSLSKSGSNPVFQGTGTGWEEYVRHPCVIKVGSTYHLFYDGRDDGPRSGIGSVGHATSSDGISWTRDSANNPILEPVSATGWEDSLIAHPAVALIRGYYYLFYGAIGNEPSQGWIGLAKSLDLATWTRVANNPVINLSPPTTWADGGVGMPGIYYEDGNLHVYHTANDGTNVDIGYATLDDTQFPAPSGLTATANGSAQIDLAWTVNTTTEDNIKVYRSTSADGDGFTLLTTLSAAANSHSDTGLDPGTTYYYFVEAVEGDAVSFNSNVDSATTEEAATFQPRSGVAIANGVMMV